MCADALSSSPALRLLIVAAIDPDATSSMPMQSSDWRDLPALADRHGLAALIGPSVLAHCDAPPRIREELGRLARRQAVMALRAIAEAASISAALTAAGVRCVTLKGPAFSAWLYREVAFRRFSDLDIVVTPGDLTSACTALRSLGYALPPGMSLTTARAIYRDLGAWPMNRENSLPLDLHWRLAQRRFPMPLTADAVIDGSMPLPLGPLVLSVPSPTHMAVLTLLHGAKHLWCTLEILLAIARLLRRRDVDWGIAKSLLQHSHGWRGAAAGLILASEIFAVSLPAELDVRPDAAMLQLRAAALDALKRRAGDFPARWAERRAHRAALDRWVDRLHYDTGRLLSPTPLEWAWCPLPDRLVALYTPLRIVRLSLAAVSRRKVAGLVTVRT